MMPRFCVWLSALVLLLGAPVLLTAADDSTCLYRLLGVEKSASTQEIKRAYRRKALDTHPDKNPNQEEASIQFRAVVDAFEVLSDPMARKRYDATGTTSSTASNTNNARNPFQWHFTTRRQRTQLKDHLKVKEAKLRVMHVVSLAQLETVMLNDEKLERHLLMCFITPSTESIMEDSILYPYPFAGMSTQGIWWEDVLQTVVVRHHTLNHELVKHFHIPTDTNTPVFVFMKQNMTLTPENAVILTTSNRQVFETWVWKHLEVKVQFRNEHSHPVELYWLHDTRAHLKATLPPGESHYETTMLSHAYVARDARVDQFEGSPGRYKLMPNALVGNWTITSTTPSIVTIPTKRCMDMSGHCSFWSMNPQGECHRNPGFMHKTCALTCNVCSNNDGNGDRDNYAKNNGSNEL